MSKRQRKFKPGPRITTLAGIVEAIEVGHWLYLGRQNRPLGPGWTQNLSLLVLRRYAANNARVAIPNEPKPDQAEGLRQAMKEFRRETAHA